MTLPPPNFAKRGRDTRLRSAKHLAFIRKRLCCVWERQDCEGPVDAAHLRQLSPERGIGIKPSDNWTVGLCRKHHREQEAKEVAFQKEYGIDLVALALEYAAASPDPAIRKAAGEYQDARTIRLVSGS